MPATVQGIEFEIRGNADSAAQGLEQLATSLERLKNLTKGGLGLSALAKEIKDFNGSINTKGDKITKFAEQMTALSEAFAKVEDHIGAIAKAASALERISNLKNINVPKTVGDAIRNVGLAAESLNADVVDKIDSITRSLQRLSNIKTEPLLQLRFIRFPPIPENAGTGILSLARALEQITDSQIQRIKEFVDIFERLKGVDLSGLAQLVALTQDAEKNARQASAAFSALPKFANESFKILNKALDTTVKAVLKLASYPLKLLESALKSVARVAMNVATTPFRLLSSTLQSAASSVTNFAKNALKRLATSLSSTSRLAGVLKNNFSIAPISRLAESVKRLTSRVDTLVRSLKRVLFYRVVRTIIKEIGDALKEGTENAYWYTKTIGDTTHYISEAFDTFASASYKMENQIGAAWATLFAAIQPIIVQIIALVTRAIEVVTMFFAALSGRDTYLHAIDYAQEWAEQTERGTQAVKEWKNQLLGFDEINRLEEPSGKTGSAGDKIPDYGAMFEEADIDLGISDLADQIRDAFQSQRWKELGELIAKTLSGLFPTEAKWREWGRKVGQGINGVIQTLYSMLRTLDFRDFGNRLAGFFNNAINAIDFNTLGGLIVRKLTAALDFAIGFIERLDFHAVGKSLGDYFRGAFDEASEWLSSYDWGKVSSGLWERIKSLIDGFDVASFANSLGTFLVTAINSAADFLNGINFADVVNTTIVTLKQFFDNIRIGDLVTAIGNLWNALQTAFTSTMGAFGRWLGGINWEQTGNSLLDSLGTLLSKFKEKAEAVPWGEIWGAIETLFSTAMTRFGTWLIGIDWVETGANFTTSAMTLLGELKRVVTEVIPWGEIWEAIKGFLTGVKLTITAGDTGWDLSKLTDNEVVQKLIDAVGGLFGAKVGFTFGGVPGAILGTIYGLKLSGIINGLDFNNGTTIGESALSALLKPALNYLVGGIAGFVFTGSASGFFMGGKMALALTAGIDILKFVKGEGATADTVSLEDTINALGAAAIGGSLGAKIGMFAGGPLGGLIGFTIGAVIGFEIEQIFFGKSNGNITPLAGSQMATQMGLNNTGPYRSSYLRDVDLSGANALGQAVVEEVNNGVKAEAPTFGKTMQEQLPAEIRNAQADVESAASEIANAVPAAFTDAQSGITISLDDIANLVRGKLGEINTNSISDGDQLYNNLTYLYGEIKGTADQAFSEMEASVSGHLQNIVDDVYSKVQEIGSAISSLSSTIQNAMNFTWSIPRPQIPVINVWYDYAPNGAGQPIPIPRFDINWYAKGGIVDGATLIGAGEAGKEAIIPLERNTEWISKVAAEMNAQMERSGDTAEDMRMAVYEGVMAAMSMQDSQEQAPAEVHVYLDSREIRASQRRYDRAMGVV